VAHYAKPALKPTQIQALPQADFIFRSADDVFDHSTELIMPPPFHLRGVLYSSSP
jgi:hypothetical protein